jgi:hypothetical protein
VLLGHFHRDVLDEGKLTSTFFHALVPGLFPNNPLPGKMAVQTGVKSALFSHDLTPAHEVLLVGAAADGRATAH